MADRLKSKVAIVTGAGSVGPGVGNGKASAILYAREGARVVLVDLNLDAARETERIIREEGGICTAVAADVTKSVDCKRVVDTCVAEYGGLDILHNNVGVTKAGGAVEQSEEDWDRIMTVNVKSMFLMCKFAVPEMQKRDGGSIVNISSVNSIHSTPAMAVAYAASKGAVNALTREVAVQYAPQHIRCNAVLPGVMRTPMVEAQLAKSYGGDPEEMNRRRSALCPMNVQGDGWDTAYAALYLASEESKYVTGTTLVVDGGLTGWMPQVEPR
jgi:NAD(P)-dependent dehydrogenase (short-subunit alcohol dehydrogenase family)